MFKFIRKLLNFYVENFQIELQNLRNNKFNPIIILNKFFFQIIFSKINICEYRMICKIIITNYLI